MTDAYWSADVPVSMPIPPADRVGVEMDGFAFTESGMAHNITEDAYTRMSIPDYQPPLGPMEVVFEDLDVDAPPKTQEHF